MDKTLYVVDDNPDHHFLFYKLLKQYSPQHKVMFFDESTTLFSHLLTLHRTGQNLPSLIILDLNMPGKNGLQLLKQLKEPFQDTPSPFDTIPVVIMSSETSQQKIHLCYQLGASAYIEKPTGFERMEYTVKAICDFWLEVNYIPPSPPVNP